MQVLARTRLVQARGLDREELVAAVATERAAAGPVAFGLSFGEAEISAPLRLPIEPIAGDQEDFRVGQDPDGRFPVAAWGRRLLRDASGSRCRLGRRCVTRLTASARAERGENDEGDDGRLFHGQAISRKLRGNPLRNRGGFLARSKREAP